MLDHIGYKLEGIGFHSLDHIDLDMLEDIDFHNSDHIGFHSYFEVVQLQLLVDFHQYYYC